MDKKTHLRTIAKTARKELDIKNISHELCTNLRKADFYCQARHVMIFYPAKYEIDTLELLKDDKEFYLPRVSGTELLVCPYSEDLMTSEFGIKEPCTNPVSSEILDLIIVPALMADKNHYRLGYGGGFYDRFLARYPDIMTVTLLAKEFLQDELPHETFDVPVNYLIVV